MVDYPETPFHLQILKSLREFGEAVALTDNNGDMSFRELYELSYRFAAVLDSMGLTKGDCILAVLPNCSWYPVAFLGAAVIGCPLSGASQDSTSEEIAYYARKSGARAAICTEKNFSALETVLSTKKEGSACGEAKIIPRDLPAWNETLPADFRGIQLGIDDVLLLPFSSGTGGKPRCVQLTHRNYSSATAILKAALFDKLVDESRRRTVAVLPFYHASGFWALLYCLLEGCHTIIMESFHPMEMLEIIHRYKVDTLNVVPAIISFLCRVDTGAFDLSFVRTVLCGSSPLGKELTATFLQKFPSVENFIQGYGMTEIVVLSHITPLGFLSEDHLGSCGKLLPGFEAQLRDPDSGLVINRPNCPGELFLRSPTVMSGYLAADRAVDDPDVLEDGWLRTGDILYYDEDGFYYVVDRLKDLIKVNGVQVSPSEMEDVILSHRHVREAAVIGIDHPDSGQIPKAFIVVEQGVDDEQIRLEVMSLVKEKLSPIKQLRGGIEVVKELPRTSSGKVKRSELRKTKAL
ncbi:hypothetical protein Q1695_013904 [Nippostrongylus brasiliensis]|nr:hypothetical protein Q1695_013904 [Nippostrongylus brasiliensis]